MLNQLLFLVTLFFSIKQSSCIATGPVEASPYAPFENESQRARIHLYSQPDVLLGICTNCRMTDLYKQPVDTLGEYPVVAMRNVSAYPWVTRRKSADKRFITFTYDSTYPILPAEEEGEPLWVDSKMPRGVWTFECAHMQKLTYGCIFQNLDGLYLCVSKDYRVLGNKNALYATTVSSTFTQDCYFTVEAIANQRQSLRVNGRFG